MMVEFASGSKVIKLFFDFIEDYSYENDDIMFLRVKLLADTIILNEITIFPWKTYQQFVQAFLNANIPKDEILPNKKLLEQNDEYFTISTIVSYDNEILKVVKYWLPYIKIVSPQYLQEKLNDMSRLQISPS